MRAREGPVVRLRGVAKRFGPVRAVDGVQFELRAGEMVALLGANAAGKTTTLNVLLGLLAPDDGTVCVFDDTPRAAAHAGLVGTMLQEGGLPTGVRVGELVDAIAAQYPAPLTRTEVLHAAGLEGLVDRRVERLSGGQTQRVRFALALVGGPRLLVLDEPTAAMDVQARRDFWASLRMYARGGRTVLFSTHHLEEADANADRIVMLVSGRVVADGSANEIKRRVGGRTVSFDADGVTVNDARGLPGVAAAEQRSGRLVLRCSDSDAAAAALFRHTPAPRNVEIVSAGLEEAFLALTDPRDQ